MRLPSSFVCFEHGSVVARRRESVTLVPRGEGVWRFAVGGEKCVESLALLLSQRLVETPSEKIASSATHSQQKGVDTNSTRSPSYS